MTLPQRMLTVSSKLFPAELLASDRCSGPPPLDKPRYRTSARTDHIAAAQARPRETTNSDQVPHATRPASSILSLIALLVATLHEFQEDNQDQ